MCEKRPYSNPRIDECLRKLVARINKTQNFRTIASCCGHERYYATIVMVDKTNGIAYEWFSETELPRIAQQLGRKKRGRRIYQQDIVGHYFLPELPLRKR